MASLVTTFTALIRCLMLMSSAQPGSAHTAAFQLPSECMCWPHSYVTSLSFLWRDTEAMAASALECHKAIAIFPETAPLFFRNTTV